jgi:hypothetical protein
VRTTRSPVCLQGRGEYFSGCGCVDAVASAPRAAIDMADAASGERGAWPLPWTIENLNDKIKGELGHSPAFVSFRANY